MSVAENIARLTTAIPPHITLIAVSKTKPAEIILEAYRTGQRAFGENKVQEMEEKYQQLPKDIAWHFIGHLQTNKVKYIAPFVSLIQSADSLKLLKEIDKQAAKHHRIIDCLLQIHIAQEETKFGFSAEEADIMMHSNELEALTHIRIAGMMGMATNTDNAAQVKKEFHSLHALFLKTKNDISLSKLLPAFTILSMGMSGDYRIAIEEGSNMIRLGSTLFGSRNTVS